MLARLGIVVDDPTIGIGELRSRLADGNSVNSATAIAGRNITQLKAEVGAGSVGPAGPAGTNGINGAAGINGLDGAVGPAGVDGAVGPAGSGTLIGIVGMDSYAGATDNIKFLAALADVQNNVSANYKYAIQFPARSITLTTSITMFNGLKLIGPYYQGPKNLEIANTVAHKVTLLVGGSGIWLNGSGSVYDVFIGSVAFQAGNSTQQFLAQPTGTLYACEFFNLTIYGFKYAFGTPAAKCLITQVVFSGHWTVIGSLDTAFTLGGSDCSLWMSGYVNLESSSAGGAAKYQCIFDSQSKTNVGFMYITSVNGWRGLLCQNNSAGLNFYGGAYEGKATNNLCDGNVIRVTGGTISFICPWIAYGMGAPAGTEHGVVEQTAGDLLIIRPTYGRGNSLEATPFFYQSGGKAQFIGVTPDTHDSWSGTPVLTSVNGTITDDRVAAIQTISIPLPGAFVAGTSAKYRYYNDTGKALTIVSCRLYCGTIPTGADVIVDVMKNGATIYTTPANRPKVLATTQSNPGISTPDIQTLYSGSWIGVDYIQVGATITGGDGQLFVVVK